MNSSTDLAALREENTRLREQLEQAEETLRAIRHGEVDALVMDGEAGPQVYVLQGLDAEQSRFRGDILAQVNEAVIAVDSEQRLIYANAAAEHRYGFTASQLLGQRLTEIYRSAWPRPEAEEEMIEALRATGSWTGELAHITRGGDRINVEASVTVMLGVGGVPKVYLAVIRDVSERLRLAEELRANERRARALVENISEDIILLDASGRIIYESPYQASLLGFALGETIGRNCFELIHPDDVDQARRDLATTASQAGGRVSGEARMRHNDGTWRWIHYHAANQLHDPAVAGLVLNLRDISAAKETEESLRKSEMRFRIAQEHSPDGFTILKPIRDAEGHTVDFIWEYTNPTIARLTGVIAQEAKGKRLLELFPGHQGTQFLSAYQHVADTGEIRIFEDVYGAETMIKPTWFRIAVVPLGEDIAIFAEDITARKEAEASLEAQTELLKIVFDHMPAAISLIRGSDLRLILINPSYRALAPGKTEFVGKTLDEIWPETGRDFSALCRQVMETGEPHHAVDERFTIQRDPDGPLDEAYFSWSLYRVRLPDNEGWGIFNSAWETTARVRTEEKLLKAHRQIESLINNTPALVYTLDLEGRFLLINNALAELMHATPEQILGKRRVDFMNPDDAARHEANDREVAEAGEAMNFEEESQLADGTIIWMTTKFPLRDAQGKIYATAGISSDMTERKRVEEELRRSRGDFAKAQEVGQMGSWRLDVRTNVLTWSEECHRIFGAPTSESLTYEIFLSIVHPEDRSYVEERWGAALHQEPYDIEHRILVAGEVKWVREKAYFEFNEAGELTSAFGITQDITARKQVEEDLRRSLHEITELRAAMDEHSIVSITDAMGCITYVNDKFCTISKFTREELVGQDHRIVNSGYHSKEFIQNLWQTIENGRVWHGEVKNRAKDGSHYWLASTIVPFLDDFGNPRQYVAIRTDITEAKETEESLLMKNDELTRFNRAAVNRELRMIELKNEINALCALTGQAPRYGTD